MHATAHWAWTMFGHTRWCGEQVPGKLTHTCSNLQYRLTCCMLQLIEHGQCLATHADVVNKSPPSSHTHVATYNTGWHVACYSSLSMDNVWHTRWYDEQVPGKLTHTCSNLQYRLTCCMLQLIEHGQCLATHADVMNKSPASSHTHVATYNTGWHVACYSSLSMDNVWPHTLMWWTSPRQAHTHM